MRAIQNAIFVLALCAAFLVFFTQPAAGYCSGTCEQNPCWFYGKSSGGGTCNFSDGGTYCCAYSGFTGGPGGAGGNTCASRGFTCKSTCEWDEVGEGLYSCPSFQTCCKLQSGLCRQSPGQHCESSPCDPKYENGYGACPPGQGFCCAREKTYTCTNFGGTCMASPGLEYESVFSATCPTGQGCYKKKVYTCADSFGQTCLYGGCNNRELGSGTCPTGQSCCGPEFTCEKTTGQKCELASCQIGWKDVAGTCPNRAACCKPASCYDLPGQHCDPDLLCAGNSIGIGECPASQYCCPDIAPPPNTSPTCILKAVQDSADLKKFTFTATASDKEDDAAKMPITSGSLQYGDLGTDGKATPAESVASISAGKSHTYSGSAAINSYTATLTVRDTKGATGTCTKTVSYNITPPAFTCPAANCKASCPATEEEDKTKTCSGAKLCCLPKPPVLSACEAGDGCKPTCVAPEFDTAKATKTCNDGAGGKVCCTPNGPPEKPKIEGPQTGLVGARLSYKFTSTDPDADQIRYGIDWGMDGTADEWLPSATGLVNSGLSQTATPHAWSATGTKTFQALAQDSRLNKSGWAQYSVVISDDACDNPNATCLASCSAAGKIKDDSITGSSDPLCSINGAAAECCLNPAPVACTSGLAGTACRTSCDATTEQTDWLQGTCNDNAGSTVCCVPKPEVSISASPASITEHGPISAITISCANRSNGQISVGIGISGSAQNGMDYSLNPAGNNVPITCPANVQIILTPSNNGAVGPPSKRAAFTLQPGTAYTISRPEGTVTIEDDDKYTCEPSGTCMSGTGCHATENRLDPARFTCAPGQVCCAPKPPATTNPEVCDPGDMCRRECIFPEAPSSRSGHKQFCNDGAGSRVCCSPGAAKIPGDLASIEITTEKKAYRTGETINLLITVRRLERKTLAEPLVERVELKTARILPSRPAIAMAGDSVVFGSLVAGLNGTIGCTDPKAFIKICGRRVDNPARFGINGTGASLAPGNYTLTATITEIYDDSAQPLIDPVTFNNTAGTFIQVYDSPTSVPEIPPLASLLLAILALAIARFSGRKAG